VVYAISPLLVKSKNPLDFHKLGTLLYFENIKELKDFVILDAQWLFEVMASLFTTKQRSVKEHGQMWQSYPKDIHEKLLQLIEKFQIAFLVLDREKCRFC